MRRRQTINKSSGADGVANLRDHDNRSFRGAGHSASYTKGAQPNNGLGITSAGDESELPLRQTRISFHDYSPNFPPSRLPDEV